MPTTTILWSQGWSLYTGLTVQQYFKFIETVFIEKIKKKRGGGVDAVLRTGLPKNEHRGTERCLNLQKIAKSLQSRRNTEIDNSELSYFAANLKMVS